MLINTLSDIAQYGDDSVSEQFTQRPQCFWAVYPDTTLFLSSFHWDDSVSEQLSQTTVFLRSLHTWIRHCFWAAYTETTVFLSSLHREDSVSEQLSHRRQWYWAAYKEMTVFLSSLHREDCVSEQLAQRWQYFWAACKEMTVFTSILHGNASVSEGSHIDDYILQPHTNMTDWQYIRQTHKEMTISSSSQGDVIEHSISVTHTAPLHYQISRREMILLVASHSQLNRGSLLWICWLRINSGLIFILYLATPTYWIIIL